MATGGGNDGNGGRRPQQNLQGLLKFCAETTQNEDTSIRNDRGVAPMTAERRKYLEDVFASLHGSDPIKVIVGDINVILAPDEDTERKEQALEDLQIHCEDLDLANDFHKLGGTSLLNRLMKNDHAGFRWQAAEIVGTLAQNNPYSQQALLDEENLLHNLVQILETDPEEVCKVKALLAISCMIRQFPAGQEAFITKHDGFSTLVKALQTDIEKLHTKAAFMIASLCHDNKNYESMLVNMGLIEQLVALLHAPHGTHHEHLMRALLILTETNDDAQAECRRGELSLRTLLQDRAQLLQGKEEYEEELEYANKLRRICFQGNGRDVER